MTKYMIASALSIILPVFLLIYGVSQSYSGSPTHTDVQGYIIGRRTTVSAFIGTARYTVTGYTSPLATVKLEGQGIYNETTADTEGRFTFHNGFSPLTPREVCITATDIYGRITHPVCLPAFPIKQDISIGPVILPPTLSLNQPSFVIGDSGILRGLGTPGSTIDISTTLEANQQNLHISTLANDKGEYSITLPTAHKDTVHITTRSKLNELESIASNFLSFHILPWWLLIIQWLLKALGSLKGNIIPVVLFIEALLLAYLGWFYVAARREKHPLALRLEEYLNEKDTT